MLGLAMQSSMSNAGVLIDYLNMFLLCVYHYTDAVCAGVAKTACVGNCMICLDVAVCRVCPVP